MYRQMRPHEAPHGLGSGCGLVSWFVSPNESPWGFIGLGVWVWSGCMVCIAKCSPMRLHTAWGLGVVWFYGLCRQMKAHGAPCNVCKHRFQTSISSIVLKHRFQTSFLKHHFQTSFSNIVFRIRFQTLFSSIASKHRFQASISNIVCRHCFSNIVFQASFFLVGVAWDDGQPRT